MADPQAFQFAIEGVDESDAAFAAVERRAARSTERLSAGARTVQDRFARVTGPARMLSPELDRAYSRMAKIGKLTGSMREAFVSTRVQQNTGMARAERDALAAAQKAADRVTNRGVIGRAAIPAALAAEPLMRPANDAAPPTRPQADEALSAAAGSAFEATYAKEMLAAEKRLGVRGGVGMRTAMARIEKDARAGADRAATQAVKRHKLGRFTGDTAEAAGAQHREQRQAAGGRAAWAENLERAAYDRAYKTHQDRGLRRFGLGASDVARRFAGAAGGGGEAAQVAGLGRAAVGAGEALGAAGTAAEGAALGLAGMVLAIPAAVAGAAVAAAKFVSPYARAGQEISRTADLIGASAEKLQRWRGAAELQGLNAHAADSAIQNLGQALHNARFGIGDPNQTRLLQLAGVDLKKDDEETALQKIAAKLTGSGYDAFSKKKYADMLGVSEMLPVLNKGPDAIKADLALIDRTGSVQTKEEVDKGVRASRSFTLFDMSKRGLGKRAAMGGVADVAIAGSDTARAGLQEINAADPVVMARQLAGVTANFLGGGDAVKGLGKSARRAADALGGVAEAVVAPKAHAESPTEIMRQVQLQRQRAAERHDIPAATASGKVKVGNRNLNLSDEAEMLRLLTKYGASPVERTVLTASAGHESSFNPHAKGDPDPATGRPTAFGLFQWRGVRAAAFEKMFGHHLLQATPDEQVRFALSELRGQAGDPGARRAGDKLHRETDYDHGNETFVRGFERSRNPERDIRERGEIITQLRRAFPGMTEGDGRSQAPMAHTSGEITVRIEEGRVSNVRARSSGPVKLKVQRGMPSH